MFSAHLPLRGFTTAAVLPLAIGGLLLGTETFAWRTLGTALVGLGLYGGWALLGALDPAAQSERHRGWVGRLRGALPYLVLTAVCICLLWPCLLGRMPMSHDHPVHLTRAWHFVTHNLAEGRLSGWSDLWFAGWPSGEDYPPGTDWWIAGFFLGSFGALGWEGSYAIAFFAMYAATALVFFEFGRVYLGRTAGLLAGLFFLLDRGAYREGGWTFTVEWGVWPQTLSLAFLLLALATLDKVIRHGRPRQFILCGSLTALAVVTHPSTVLLLALGVPLYVAVRCLNDDAPAGAVIARTLGAMTLGAALSAFWLLPFAAKSDWMIPHGKLWDSLEVMADGLWSGTVFGNVTPALVWLGLVGGAVAVVRRHWAGTFLAVLAAALLFLISSTAFIELDYLDVSSAFGHVTYRRLSLPVKACFFLLAGFLLQVLFARIGRGRRPAFSWRRYAVVGLVSLALAPFVPALAQSWTRGHAGDLGRLLTKNDIPHWQDYREFLQWSAGLRKQDDDFYRIAYLGSRHDHLFLGAPVYNDTPLFKSGFTPALMFKHRPDTADPSLLRLLSVKWVVSLRELSNPSCEFHRRFGLIWVYRFRDYDPARYTLEGPGRVEVLAFEPDDETIRLRVSGTDGTSRLTLHVAPYANWRATVDGKPLEITTARLSGHEHFMSVPGRDGVIEFDYVSPASNLLGRLCTGLALGLVVLLLWCRVRPASSVAGWSRKTLAPWWQRAERQGVAIGGLLGLGLIAAPLVLSATAPTPPGDPLRKHLAQARVELVGPGLSEPCMRQRSTRFQCGKPLWNHVGAAAVQSEKVLRRCIWAHPVKDRTLRIVFPDVQLGSVLAGHHGLADDAAGYGTPVELAVSIDGRPVGRFGRPDEKGWEAWEIDTSDWKGERAKVVFEVRSEDDENRDYCFEPVILP